MNAVLLAAGELQGFCALRLDVEGVLLVQRERLDLSLIQRELKPLLELKEQPELLERFARLCRKCGIKPRF